MPTATATRKPTTRRNGTKAATAKKSRPKAATTTRKATSSAPTVKEQWPPYPGEVKFGDKGPGHAARVKVWQRALQVRVSPKLVLDGNYGDGTYHCVMVWQKAHPHGRPVMDNPFPKGFMGPHMWHSLTKNI